MDEAKIMAEVGRQGIERMVKAFYKRISKDFLLGPMYPQDDMEGSEQRLFDFLMFRFAGDEKYIQERGHPKLRARHMPFVIGTVERDRWLMLMNEAMVEAELPANVVEELGKFFAQVADFMRNVPDEGGVHFQPKKNESHGG